MKSILMMLFLSNFFSKKKKLELFTKESFFKLSQEQKSEACQKLNPYDATEREIFKEVEEKFIEEYGNHEAIESVFCGLAPMMGYYNSINITVGKGKKRLFLPKKYHGFPILKSYASKNNVS
ncbi:MAG: hypothetical protein JXR05_05670 [Flavobacteriaceae bacterium]